MLRRTDKPRQNRTPPPCATLPPEHGTTASGHDTGRLPATHVKALRTAPGPPIPPRVATRYSHHCVYRSEDYLSPLCDAKDGLLGAPKCRLNGQIARQPVLNVSQADGRTCNGWSRIPPAALSTSRTLARSRLSNSLESQFRDDQSDFS